MVSASLVPSLRAAVQRRCRRRRKLSQVRETTRLGASASRESRGPGSHRTRYRLLRRSARCESDDGHAAAVRPGFAPVGRETGKDAVGERP